MDLPTILLIALGLSMDAVAVALGSGCSAGQGKVNGRQALLLASLFGVFQGLMPVAGWLAGLGFKGVISSFDHWLAFILLAFIGIKMIREAPRRGECRVRGNGMTLAVMLGLAVATSIDALAVGLSFSVLAVGIVVPVLIIGAVTFVLSLAAVYAGQRFGSWLAGRAELLGGLILIAIGLRILLEHLRAV
ncbi:MAG: manganese efflux pump MntP family protein [Acidobacteria bacterium]|jgi:putative Mn2+ efflux pump MntP|nr:manganese efflux pump MntP family protein [Acidobacteriota bacterium]